MLLLGVRVFSVPIGVFASLLILFSTNSLLLAQDSIFYELDTDQTKDYNATRISNETSATKMVAYNNDLGFIQEKRSINNLSEGLNIVRFEDVAAFVEPSSVFLDFADSNCCILGEQAFEYDILNLEAVFQKLLGKEITLYIDYILESEFADNGNKSDNSFLPLISSANPFTNTSSSSEITGKLLAFEQDNVIISDRREGGGTTHIKIVPAETIKLISLPSSILSDFVIKPSLVLKIYTNNTSSTAEEEQKYEEGATLSYLTRGINWNADYIGVLDNEDSNLDIQGWITLDNQAGGTFRNATLELIAGDVNIEPEPYAYAPSEAGVGRGPPESVPPTIAESKFFDYHLYSVNGTIDEIKDKETKQLKLFDSENIKMNKTYTYDTSVYITGIDDTIPVSVTLSFNNTEENNDKGLGIPMPEGTIRIYEQNTDDQDGLIFIGEDSIGHTPINENISLNVGNAFDIVGETTLVSESNPSDTINIKKYSVTLKDRSNQSTTVLVNVNDLYDDWTIIDNTIPFIQKDASTVQFSVPISAGSQRNIEYGIQTITHPYNGGIGTIR